MSDEAASVWSFGYGSNMDVKALETKKHVKILGTLLMTPLNGVRTGNRHHFLAFQTTARPC